MKSVRRVGAMAVVGIALVLAGCVAAPVGPGAVYSDGPGYGPSYGPGYYYPNAGYAPGYYPGAVYAPPVAPSVSVGVGGYWGGGPRYAPAPSPGYWHGGPRALAPAQAPGVAPGRVNPPPPVGQPRIIQRGPGTGFYDSGRSAGTADGP